MSDLSKAMKEATAYLDRQKDERKSPEQSQPENPHTKVNSVRSKSREAQSNPILIVAYGFAVALAIFAGGLSTQWLVPALGAGFGIATTIISKGLASTSVDYSWVIPAGAAGIVLIGGVAVVFLLMKIVRHAATQPYLAVLPLLAAIAGFCVDMCKNINFHKFLPN